MKLLVKIALRLFVVLISVLFRYLTYKESRGLQLDLGFFINYETYKLNYFFFQFIWNTSSVNYIATAIYLIGALNTCTSLVNGHTAKSPIPARI